MRVNLSPQHKIIGDLLLSKHDLFTRFTFETLEGVNIPTKFDKVFGETIDRIFAGEIKRLIINMPPSLGKTARAVIALTARGFAINPSSRFLHISYSNDLVKLNSSTIKGFIQSEEYQTLYPHVQLLQDTTAKGLWKTTKGGAFKASPSGGAITGFRAGRIGAKEFSGALIIDDPLKPDDALSNKKREFINNRFENTFKSRVADNNVPIIVIMQRIHEKDFTNHLLERYGKEWYHLIIPSLVEADNRLDDRGTRIESDLPHGSILEAVYPKDSLLLEKVKNPLYFFSQLQQAPATGLSSEVLSGEWLPLYPKEHLPKIISSHIYVDTALKDEDKHDYTVLHHVGLGKDGKLYSLRMKRGKYKFIDLVHNTIQFWIKCKQSQHPPLTVRIEDRASGTSLIQTLQYKGMNVVAIGRTKSKLYRISVVGEYFYNGYFLLPDWKPYHVDVKREFDEFREDDSHPNDDIIDTCLDAMEHNLTLLSYKGGVKNAKITDILPI